MDRCRHFCFGSVPRNYGHHHHERGHTYARRGIWRLGSVDGVGRDRLSPRARSMDSRFWLDRRQSRDKENLPLCTLFIHCRIGSVWSIEQPWSAHRLSPSSGRGWRHARARGNSHALPLVSPCRAGTRINYFDCSHRCCTSSRTHHRWRNC